MCNSDSAAWRDRGRTSNVSWLKGREDRIASTNGRYTVNNDIVIGKVVPDVSGHHEG